MAQIIEKIVRSKYPPRNTRVLWLDTKNDLIKAFTPNGWTKVFANTAINTLRNAGYLFAGIATIDTNPEIPDAKVFYIANGKGTYTNFGGINVTEDEIVILKYDTAWHKVATGIASEEKLSELEDNLYESSSIELQGETADNTIIKNNGSTISGDGYENYKVVTFGVAEGQTIEISGSADYSNRVYCFYNEDNLLELGDVGSGSSTATNIVSKKVVVPSSANKLRVSFKLGSQVAIAILKSRSMIDVKTLQTQIAESQKTINAITTSGEKQLTPSQIISGYCIDKTGSITDAGMAAFSVYVFNISEYNTIDIIASTRYSNSYYAFYNDRMEVVEVGDTHTGSTTDTIAKVDIAKPSGAKYIAISGYGMTPSAMTKDYCYVIVPKNKWHGKKWVCLGDSLTAINSTTTKRYFDYIKEETDINPVNMGESGTGYASKRTSGRAFYQRVSEMPNDADVVTIFGSFNDLKEIDGFEIGNEDDKGETSMAGCINLTLDAIQNLMPLAKLGVIAPTPWDSTQPNEVPTSKSYQYFTILKKICERRSIPFLDLWHGSGLHPWDVEFRRVAYSKDTEQLDGNPAGTHPDENGHLFIAPKIKNFLETLIL